MNWLRTNWTLLTFLGTFLAGAVTAWADTQNEIKNLKAEQSEQKIVREQVIRQDEQLKAIKESQRTQEALLRELVRSQQAIERKVVRGGGE